MYLRLTSYLILWLSVYSTHIAGLVPRPTNYDITTTACSLLYTPTYQHDYPSCLILTNSLRNFESRLALRHIPIDKPTEIKCSIHRMKVEIRDGCDESEYKLWPSGSMDESYNITIHDQEINITSNEIWGVLHALETILQLVYTNEVGENLIFKGRIEDDPVFAYRGVLVNTGSNFIPMEYLFKTIGAFHPQFCTYDEEEVADLLEYARLRGVRVIPEFNTPDHTLSWGNGYPDILTKCYKDSEPDGNLGPLNPTNPETFTFLENFYKEVVTRFSDSYLYLGGDVEFLSCW
ncbi:unnamed protein product [Trichobilharzia regenti]|nr:unnamed protein product [Trichobilharzia regenti]